MLMHPDSAAPGQASTPSIWCPGWLGPLSVIPARPGEEPSKKDGNDF